MACLQQIYQINNLMKYILFAIAMVASFELYAQIQAQKTVSCADTAGVLENLRGEDFKEQLQWTGSSSDDRSKYALMVNPDTGGWTIIQFNSNLACVLGTGVTSTLLTVKPVESQM